MHCGRRRRQVLTERGIKRISVLLYSHSLFGVHKRVHTEKYGKMYREYPGGVPSERDQLVLMRRCDGESDGATAARR